MLGLGVALRVAVAIAYGPALFWGDSWDYLNMAYMRFPVGYSPVHPSGYPLVIKALSLAGHHLMFFTTMQHLAGLAVGLLVYLLLTRRHVPRWLAAAATGVVLLDLYAISLEQTILAEAFFTLTLLGAVYLAICVPPTSIALSASGALLAAATLMRLAGAFALPAWLLYLAWKRVGLRPLVVGLVSFAIPLLVSAADRHSVTGKFGLSEADGWFLYARIGEIASPCGNAKVPAATRSLCERSGEPHAGAGFYIWNPASPARKRFGDFGQGTDRGRQANRLLREFAVAIIRDRPLEYGKLVLRDFGRYFEPGLREGRGAAVHLPTAAETELDSFARGVLTAYFPGYVPRRKYDSAAFLPRVQRWLHTPRWLMAVFAVCALAAWAFAVIRRDHRSGGSHGEAIFLVGSGLLILLGSSATSDFDLRYLIPEVPLFVCGGVLAIWQLTSARLPSSRQKRA
jgi:hypothetical protein